MSLAGTTGLPYPAPPTPALRQPPVLSGSRTTDVEPMPSPRDGEKKGRDVLHIPPPEEEIYADANHRDLNHEEQNRRQRFEQFSFRQHLHVLSPLPGADTT